ncbi:hypothetical protein ACFLWF_01495 [Chloroflexota bacterium]
MENLEDKTQVLLEAEKLASIKAKERSMVARWDIDIAIFLFAVLILVIILLFQNIGIEFVAPVAIFGLSMVWLVGARRGNQLYKKFYIEELARINEKLEAKKHLMSKKTMDETIEEKVQKALLDRFQ